MSKDSGRLASIHALVFATNYRNVDNYSDLFRRLQERGGKVELLALPWTGDPSYPEFSRLPFETRLRHPISQLSPHGIDLAALESVLEEGMKSRPDLLFLVDMQSYPSNAVYSLVKPKPERPLCIGLQHGVFQSWWMYNRNFCADFLFCFGKRHVDELRADLRWRALPVGLPKLDRLRGVACSVKPFILYIAQKFPEAEIVYPALARYQEYRNIPILVRNHPQYPANLPGLSSGQTDAIAELDPNGDLVELLALCETVITPHSTAALEALYLGKPVVLLPNHGLTAFAKYPGVSLDFSSEQIEAARCRVLSEPESVSAFLDDVVGGLRFDHTDRALEAVVSLLEKRSRGVLLLNDKGVFSSTQEAGPSSPIDSAPHLLPDLLGAHRDSVISEIKSELHNLFGPIDKDHRRRTYDRRILFELLQRMELGFGDLLEVVESIPETTDPIRVTTEFPLAIGSYDHQQPLGTAQDNTRGVGFCLACEEILGNKLRLLDLGCAGGGIVMDFALRGHFAVGLEGSDYSRRAGRAAWRFLRKNLFTADISKPFRITDSEGRPVRFDIVSCWEVLEHLEEECLETFLENVSSHLRPGGLFVGTVAHSTSRYHRAVKPREWWEQRLCRKFLKSPLPFAREELPRGVTAGLYDSADYFVDPNRGFHFCAVQPDSDLEDREQPCPRVGDVHISAVCAALPQQARLLVWGGAETVLALASQRGPDIRLTAVLHSAEDYSRLRSCMDGQQNVHLLFPFGSEASDHADVAPYINAADGESFDVILVAGLARQQCLKHSSFLLRSEGLVFLHDAQRPAFDNAKSSFFEYGHIGACEGIPDSQLWWGGKTRRPDNIEGCGDLPVIVSFFTTGTLYETEAVKLAETCHTLGLEHEVAGIPSRGTWEDNCAYKASFLFDAWQRLARPLLWVDADAVVRRKPTLLAGTAADFAIHKVDGWKFASGTLFFNQTALAGELLARWSERCKRDPATWDQEHLDLAWEEMVSKRPLHTLWLPQSYTKIFDKKAECAPTTTVFEHFQASRRAKREYRSTSPVQLLLLRNLQPARQASRPRTAAEFTFSRITAACAAIGKRTKQTDGTPGSLTNMLMTGAVKVVGWGCGSGFYQLHKLHPLPLAYLLDNDESRWGSEFSGLSIHPPVRILEEDPEKTIVLVYSSFFDAIKDQVSGMGPYLTIRATEELLKRIDAALGGTGGS